jgi:hypothetical protein
MNPKDDRDVRERFAALRDEDAASAPPFSGVLRGRTMGSPLPRSRLIPVTVLATAAIVTAVVLVAIPRGADLSIDAAIVQAKSLSSWTAPTDAWLTLSGLEIPNSVPSLSLSSVALPEASTAATTTGESR